jgi:hypothetical protein
MTRSIRSLLAIALLSTVAFSQPALIRANGLFKGGIEIFDLQLQAPPNSFFDIYYAFDLNGNGLTHLTSGQVGPTGVWDMYIPLNGNMQVQQLWIGAIVHPPAVGGAVIAGPIAVGVKAAVAACNPSGILSWDPTTCTVTLVAHACPGDVIDLVINGVVVLTGVAGANGVVVLAQGGLCGLPAGSTFSGNRNGAGWLGAIIK